MAPRRSANGASQRHTQAQQQRRHPTPDDQVSHDASAGSDGEASTARQHGNVGTARDSETRHRASQLVRLALFFEYKRRALSRAEIVKQVMPSEGRAFNAVLEAAQEVLKSTFGMELYELPKRSAHQADGTEAAETQTQTQRGKGKGRARDEDAADVEDEDDVDVAGATAGPAAGAGGRSKRPPGSKTYILRSILPREIVAEMSQPRALPMPSSSASSPDDADEPVDAGALLQWEKGDGTPSGHIAMMGIRAVILSLVLCYGRSIDDDVLHALLRRLNLDRNTVLPYTSPDARDPPIDLDKYLDLLARQNYLEKVKTAVPGTRDRDADKVSWRWGSRDAEFSEKAAAEFIARIFLESERDDDSPDEGEGEDDEAEDRVTLPQRDRRHGNGDARGNAGGIGRGDTSGNGRGNAGGNGRRANAVSGRSGSADNAVARRKKRAKVMDDVEKAAGGPLTGTV